MSKSDWSDGVLLRRVGEWVQSLLQAQTGRYWIIDDTGFPKNGKHSVGVARQYCGQLGKQDNCQVAVSLSLATEQGSLPIAYQLYLPKEWAADETRRQKAGVPAGVVLADATYGNETGFRESLTELGLLYAVGIGSVTTVWPPGVSPLPAKPASGPGRPAAEVAASRTRP